MTHRLRSEYRDPAKNPTRSLSFAFYSGSTRVFTSGATIFEAYTVAKQLLGEKPRKARFLYFSKEMK